ncbi:hypothetical protein TTHERM_001256585 (macronuclear) [Tetrahymena thermophila SB210]|uniref:Uncharacterized protein n=1 Tax=Tetrahymena thermophila (strain SB210) TaxID=312017 RepID=W7XIY4_TETTS|nr:hypothetical protein TTHERM_001256585 [Tetrahymena thermophila SB210]EWS75036.1 hypothetical protein TTHERM_001256585 [Tetrahymena thermophila SB210]|eukprot:XP_012652435.1 hypothetical protein TTHERM_001256585 [Tetrahymena thermophila SB210]
MIQTCFDGFSVFLIKSALSLIPIFIIYKQLVSNINNILSLYINVFIKQQQTNLNYQYVFTISIFTIQSNYFQINIQQKFLNYELDWWKCVYYNFRFRISLISDFLHNYGQSFYFIHLVFNTRQTRFMNAYTSISFEEGERGEDSDQLFQISLNNQLSQILENFVESNLKQKKSVKINKTSICINNEFLQKNQIYLQNHKINRVIQREYQIFVIDRKMCI